MHASSRQVRYPYSEYLIIEQMSDTKHEYFEGVIYAMAGGTPEHAALQLETLFIIRQQLPGECQAYTSDLRVRVPTGLSTYPDGAVICGKEKRAPDDSIAVTNPLLLLEITSDSTENYDRGEKLQQYQTIPTLKEILIVSHRERRISLHRRSGQQQWTSLEAVTGESLTLESIGVTLRVDDIYGTRLAQP
jgi:Uma2 family endonuclease